MIEVEFCYGIRTIYGDMNDGMVFNLYITEEEYSRLKAVSSEMLYEFERLDDIADIYDKVLKAAIDNEIEMCRTEYDDEVFEVIADYLGIDFEDFDIEDISDDQLSDFIVNQADLILIFPEYEFK